MTKITSFGQSECRVISAAIKKALQESGIEEEYGIVIDTKSGSYSEQCYTLKVEAAIKNEDGTVMTKSAEDFKTYCYRYGLDEEMLGKVFIDTVKGERWKVVGAKPRATKYPILVEKVSTGETYKFPADRVAKAFDAMDAG